MARDAASGVGGVEEGGVEGDIAITAVFLFSLPIAVAAVLTALAMHKKRRIEIQTGLYVLGVIIATTALTWEIASRVMQQPTVQVSDGSIPIRLVSWGGAADACSGTVDASRADEQTRHKYEAALVCGIGDPAFDRMKDERITVSPLFTLQPAAFPITVLHSKAMSEAATRMVKEAVRNAPYPKGTGVTITYLTWVKLVLLPKAVDVSSVHRLADVPKYGGEILPGDYASATINMRSKP